MEKISKFWDSVVNVYSKTSMNNHLIFSLIILLLFNYVIATFDGTVFWIFVPILLIFLLSFIRNNYKLYDISINNNGSITEYKNVKFKLDKKKGKLTIYSGSNVIVIAQGNYEIKDSLPQIT